MFKHCFLYHVLFLISAMITLSFQQRNDYISQESVDLAEINEIVDSSSKEDVTKEKLDKRLAKKIQKSNRTVESDFYTETQNATTNAEVNVTPFSCGRKKDSSSSDEGQCKSTLVNYPFSASIQKKGSHYASGALINIQHVLTAADVFFNVRETIKLFRVRLGSVNCKKGGMILPIKLVEIHPLFVQGKPSHDIALLRLSKPVEVTEFVKPIPLSRVQQEVVSAKFLTTYWPRLIVNGKVISKTAKERLKHHSMRVSTQRMIAWKTCQALMKARNTVLEETSLCLRPIITHHSSCSPDVGAPVVADDGLWGITSGWTSVHCQEYPSPTVFTRINMKPVRSWIKSIVML